MDSSQLASSFPLSLPPHKSCEGADRASLSLLSEIRAPVLHVGPGQRRRCETGHLVAGCE